MLTTLFNSLLKSSRDNLNKKIKIMVLMIFNQIIEKIDLDDFLLQFIFKIKRV